MGLGIANSVRLHKLGSHNCVELAYISDGAKEYGKPKMTLAGKLKRVEPIESIPQFASPCIDFPPICLIKDSFILIDF